MYFIDKIKAMLLLSVPKCMHGQVQLHLQPLSPQSNILCMYCTKSTGGCCEIWCNASRSAAFLPTDCIAADTGHFILDFHFEYMH